jgi:phosphatidylinositol alpha-1,6-mannosyltransferase
MYHTSPRSAPSSAIVGPVRLVLVTQDFPPRRGGIQTHALELARRLAPRLDAFAVIAPAVEGAPEADREMPWRVLRSGTSDTMIAAAGPLLLELALAEGFDHTLHAQWSTTPAALGLRGLGRVRKVATFVYGRELLLAPWRKTPLAQRGYDLVRRRSLGAVDRVLAISRYTAGLACELGVAEERVRITGCGTDPERFRPVDASALRERLGLGGRRVLLTLARLVPRKGIDSVLRALPAVRRAVPEVAYVVCGEGPEREQLERLARELGVQDLVRFAGGVPDGELTHWYCAGDVFVMPSRSEPPDVEGFGIVFLEAGACERPVVAARAGGVPDAVADGVSGLLVTPGDVDELAAKLVELLRDPARAAELGRQGRARVVAELNWERVAERTLEALE